MLEMFIPVFLNVGLFFTEVSGFGQIYKNANLGKAVKLYYTYEINIRSLTECGVRCMSTPGCKVFHKEGDICYILDKNGTINGERNVQYFYIIQAAAGKCTVDGYIPVFEGMYCIRVFNDSLTWPQAKARCEMDAGNLVMLHTQEYYIKLEALKAVGVYAEKGRHYWLGGSDLAVEGKWVWLDGSAVSRDPSIWYKNNPNNHHDEQHELELAGGENGNGVNLLNDDYPNRNNYFICEILF